MCAITDLLLRISNGDSQAAEQLWSLVYDELRALAAAKLAQEKPGQTLQPTALVHEAFLRAGAEKVQCWRSRTHFFAAAAEAMRRILVDNARRKARLKRGGDRKRQPIAEDGIVGRELDSDILLLDAALAKLESVDARKAGVVKLRFFAGMTIAETASALGISAATADRDWTYARAWLYREIRNSDK